MNNLFIYNYFLFILLSLVDRSQTQLATKSESHYFLSHRLAEFCGTNRGLLRHMTSKRLPTLGPRLCSVSVTGNSQDPYDYAPAGELDSSWSLFFPLGPEAISCVMNSGSHASMS